jgi:hypothetical protein
MVDRLAQRFERNIDDAARRGLLAATLHLRRRAVGLTKDQGEQVQADDEHERHDS